MKHDTSSIILNVCLAILACSIWPCLSPDTQIPFLRPAAVFSALPLYLTSFTERSDHDDEESQQMSCVAQKTDFFSVIQQKIWIIKDDSVSHEVRQNCDLSLCLQGGKTDVTTIKQQQGEQKRKAL